LHAALNRSACFWDLIAGRCQLRDGVRRAWVGLGWLTYHTSDVKAAFNSPYDLLRGLSGEEAGGVSYGKLGILTPWVGVENSSKPFRSAPHGHSFKTCVICVKVQNAELSQISQLTVSLLISVIFSDAHFSLQQLSLVLSLLIGVTHDQETCTRNLRR